MTDNLYIFKADVESQDDFESMIGLHNCVLAQEDDLYYILEGSSENIESFHQDWDKRKEF